MVGLTSEREATSDRRRHAAKNTTSDPGGSTVTVGAFAQGGVTAREMTGGRPDRPDSCAARCWAEIVAAEGG